MHCPYSPQDFAKIRYLADSGFLLFRLPVPCQHPYHLGRLWFFSYMWGGKEQRAAAFVQTNKVGRLAKHLWSFAVCRSWVGPSNSEWLISKRNCRNAFSLSKTSRRCEYPMQFYSANGINIYQFLTLKPIREKRKRASSTKLLVKTRFLWQCIDGLSKQLTFTQLTECSVKQTRAAVLARSSNVRLHTHYFRLSLPCVVKVAK